MTVSDGVCYSREGWKNWRNGNYSLIIHEISTVLLEKADLLRKTAVFCSYFANVTCSEFLQHEVINLNVHGNFPQIFFSFLLQKSRFTKLKKKSRKKVTTWYTFLLKITLINCLDHV